MSSNETSMTESTPGKKGFLGLLYALGPAIIVASVVLGPGSILTSTKVGAQNGMAMMWVTPIAGLLLFSYIMLATRLGVSLKGTLCDELAKDFGRWAAIFIGIVLFLVVAFFQMSNNSAILASAESFFPDILKTEANPDGMSKSLLAMLVLIPFNGLLIVVLYSSKDLYKVVERMMKFLVSLILVAFTVNLILARPDFVAVFKGLVPSLPKGDAQSNLSDKWLSVIGLIGTTFSIAGAFYQAYLVREKGWTKQDLAKGTFDSGVGVFLLAIATMMVMITAATTLQGQKITNLAQVADQLRPLFGNWAIVLFSIGIFAAAFSSFLVNAMIGGTLLSDGFGLGSKIDMKYPKQLTVLALLVGMVLSLYASTGATVNVIVVAQALTVVGMPFLAFSMLYLGIKNYKEAQLNPAILLGVSVGAIISIGLATRTTLTVISKLQQMMG